MRLTELTPSIAKRLIKDKWETPEDVKEYLIQNGYEMIGLGMYSSVWSNHGSKAVIKVSSEKDTCWLKFVEFCKANKSPYLPKVSRIAESEDNFIAFIERLEPIRNPDLKIKLDQAITGISWFGRKILDKDEFVDYIRNYPSESKMEHMDRYDYAIAPLLKKYPGFLETIAKMNSYGKNLPCEEDLHLKNVMIRPSTDIPVITDPWQPQLPHRR